MKRVPQLSTMLLLIPLLAGSAAFSTPKAFMPNAEFDIVYDGYCDGAHLRTNALGDGEAADGRQIGCVRGIMLGSAGRRALGMSYAVGSNAEGLHTVIRADGTWTHYANTGRGIYVVNQGTWSFVRPPANWAGRPSTQK